MEFRIVVYHATSHIWNGNSVPYRAVHYDVVYVSSPTTRTFIVDIASSLLSVLTMWPKMPQLQLMARGSILDVDSSFRVQYDSFSMIARGKMLSGSSETQTSYICGDEDA